MDVDKLEYHRTAAAVSEKWLVDSELTPEELEYICNKPDIGRRTEPEYRQKYLSATKSKQIEKYNVKQG